ncbi:MAG: sulfatase-like hydrolase/transferase, partial [Planctomycetota bacterium]
MRYARYYAVAALLVLLSSPVLGAKRNIILFVTDDQSPTMGCYGDPVIRTPHMDSLATEGTLFNYAFCTTASCSASRSVILSGLFNHANGQYGHQHAYHKFAAYQNLKSLPTLLEMGGYRTGRIGKYHVAPESVFRFQRVFRGDSRSPVVMADNVKDFVSEKSDQPFFLYFATSDPHRGGGKANEIPTKPDRFGNKPPGATGYPGVKEVTYDPKDVVVPHFLPDSRAARDELAQYYQ